MNISMSKKRIIYTLVVTLIVVFSTTYAILMTFERNDYRNYLQGEYSKNMYDLITSVENIRVNLTKAAIVGSREQAMAVFQEIYRNTSMATDKLNSLPTTQETAGDVNKFLAKVGDFSHSLSVLSSEGKSLSKGDYDKIENLKKQSYDLEQRLNALLGNIREGQVRWGELRKKASGVFAKAGNNLVSQQFKEIQKQVVQYPALIYDGPFSDNTLEITPKVNSKKAVSESDALKTVKKLLTKSAVEKIEPKGSSIRAKINTYKFDITLKGKKKNRATCEISKNGGEVIYLLNEREIGKASIDGKKAIEIGAKKLEELGYKNMHPTYTLKYGNEVVVSYVYVEKGIVIYPDQIKVKIALDNGEIVGMESQKYLVAHEENRKIPSVKVDQAKARQRVGKNLKITSVRLAIIPTETNKEALCYEFKGSYKGDNFLIYINSQTGYEQRIIQVINTPNGELTM